VSIVGGVLAFLSIVVLGSWKLLWDRSFTLDTNPDRNVLIVTIDTLRADALGSYGGPLTPNLDQLAAHGARFDAAHAHAVVTLPSHASIMSGTYPYEHGVRDNTGYRFDPSQPTIATLLKAQGFATGAFIGGFPLDRRFGLNAGFDMYDDRLGSAASTDGERERRADAVIQSANQWIARQRGRWFAWVHLYDPHATYAPPQEFAARSTSPYLNEVVWTDHALGVLFGGLASQPRDTLIVVTADHGEGLGDHGELTHGIFAYEAVLRVPLIIAEKRIGTPVPPAGVVVSTPARHVDLLPTVLDAVGAPIPASLAGASLREVIENGGGDERPSYFEAMSPALARGWAPLRGVVAGREKYIDLPIPELYDLVADPREADNLVPREGPRAHALFNLVRTFNVAPPTRAQAETAETLERLRSLGYIGGGTAEVREAYTEADDPKRLIELEQLLQQATDAQRQGKLDAAIGIYEQVIARRADTEDAYRKLALVHWRQGRSAEAIATLERALKNGVTQSEVRIKLAEYLAQSGQPARAIELLEATAGEDPDALIALGNAYTLADRAPDALATFQRLLALDPANALAHENAGAAHLRRRDFPAAERSLRRAIELDETRAGAHTALGVVLAETGRRSEAIVAWQRAIAIEPEELNALFNLTLNLVEVGRPAEAREYGERFIALAPRYLQKDVAMIQRLIRD
jgi:arylsulfatase A-like enzyme/Flp pilus assembly protein TadD